MTSDKEKTREALLAQVTALRKQVADLEAAAICPSCGANAQDAERIFLSALMANVPDSIYFKDRDSRFLMINRALADRFNLKNPDEAVGRSDADFFSSEHARAARADETEVMRTGLPLIAKVEKETMPDGTSRWVSTTKLPLRDKTGRVIGTFGISRDVTEYHVAEDALRRSEEELRRHRDNLEQLVTERTSEVREKNQQLQHEVLERRRAETALRLSEHRYRQLLATTPTYVYTVRYDNGRPVTTDHGSGCATITGYTPEEFAASADLWLSIVHEEDRAAVLALLGRGNHAEDRRPLEHRIVHKDGTPRWVRNTVVHHYDEHDRLQYCDGLIEDITERKFGEEALRESERIKAIGSLASGVAHSLNNVVTLVGGSASSIAENVLPGTTAYREASRIMEALEHASVLTQRLMGVAGACVVDGPTVAELVSICEVLRETKEFLETPFAERKVKIEIRDPEHMPFVKANAGQLLNTLMSLFSNAADAMPDGGTITAWCTEKRLSAPAGSSGKAKHPPGVYAVLHVRDTGAGIEKKILSRIFEPFFTTKKAAGSFGLGLTVAENLVESWGGWISVDSKVGVGSTFHVHIPRARRAPKAKPQANPDALRGQTVLLVDDDATLLTELRGGLDRAGLRVLTASSAEESLKVFNANADHIAVSIVDLLMPGTDGKAVVDHIRKTVPQARVIVMSGFPRDYARRYLGSWGWGFVQKPVMGDALVDAVSQAVFGKRAR
jgi:PAS domain S-box-containing protein